MAAIVSQIVAGGEFMAPDTLPSNSSSAHLPALQSVNTLSRSHVYPFSDLHKRSEPCATSLRCFLFALALGPFMPALNAVAQDEKIKIEVRPLSM